MITIHILGVLIGALVILLFGIRTGIFLHQIKPHWFDRDEQEYTSEGLKVDE